MRTVKELSRIIMLIVSGGLLLSCTNDGIGRNDESEVGFTVRNVTVNDPNGNSLGSVPLRFYEDMPNVPYVSVSDFQSIMYPGTTVEVSKTSSGRYELSGPEGTARVDIRKDIFESDDYLAFTNLMGQVQAGMPNIVFDALPIIRWKAIDVTPKKKTLTLDYGKFGINLRADDNGVWFPFATIADLYADSYMHIAAYNGESVLVTPNGAYSLLDGYPVDFVKPALKQNRTDDFARFSYKNLCFTLTNFYGYPGRAPLENSMHEKGLDKALQDYGKSGQMTRDLLQSTDMNDYLAGMVTLGYLLFDGGHTNMNVEKLTPLNQIPEFYESYTPIKEAKTKEFGSYGPEKEQFEKYIADRKQLGESIKKLRKETFGENVRYAKQGNTAYCLFNSFLCFDAAWRDFYNGKGPKPTLEEYPDDWLLVLVDALEKAESDPDVKNLVIDISTNGGGSSDVVLFVTSLLCNKSDMHFDDSETGQKYVVNFEVDRNLDGKFDDKDSLIKYDLNFGILVSGYSFSCANMLPSLMKDYGVPILGQKTGGGSCCIIYNPTAEGLGYSYSTHRSRLNNCSGENIDSGIIPDFEITDMADFFDLSRLGEFIENYSSTNK